MDLVYLSNKTVQVLLGAKKKFGLGENDTKSFIYILSQNGGNEYFDLNKEKIDDYQVI